MMASHDIDSPQTDSDGSRSHRTKTRRGLLEQYLSETSLSSFTEISSCRQNMEAKELVSIFNEEIQEHKTCLAPPPLLHRPTKRSLEHNQMNVTSPDSKHPRLESCSAYFDHHTERVLKEPFDVKELMFERTRSLENSLKPAFPPPPLLKQTVVNRNGRKSQITEHIPKHREIFHHTTVKWSTMWDSDQCKNKIAPLENATISNRFLDHRFQLTGTDNRRYSSCAGNAGKDKASTAQPVPRQITTDGHSSCGGYAFDHMAMPKIVAVHSVSKSTRDEDEWKRNKAFISKVKAAQDRSFHSRTPVEVREQARERLQEIPHVKTGLVISQDQQSSLQDHHWQKGTRNSSSAGLKDRSTDVSFERFALYHLLSKFQGNVEQVKRALKENLLKEWSEYSQGNTDHNKQALSGVNLSELRKLYDVWCTLKKSQRENETRSGCLANTVNSQNFEQRRVKINSELSARKDHEVCISDSQLSPDAQFPEAISAGYLSPRNMSKSAQAGHQTSLNPSPVPLNPQQIRNDITGENTRSISMQHSPMLFHEKISTLSQSSALNPTTGSKSTFSPLGASFGGHDKTAECIKLEQMQPKTNQVFACDDKQSAFGCPNKDVADSIVDHISRVSRTSQRTEVEKEGKSGSNISLRATILQHFPETTSRPAQKESFLFVNSPTTTAFCTSFVSSSSRESEKSGPHAAEKARHSDSLSAEISSGHETKVSYLWRFKGGRLISDNMPSLHTGKPITEMESTGPTVDVRMRNEIKEPELVVKREDHTPGKQSGHRDSNWKFIPQANPLVSSAVEQEHEKVCGAAASGRRCYCVVEPKCSPQREKTSTDPLQSMQNMINRAAESSHRRRSPQIYAQRPDIAVKSEKNIVCTNSAQMYQRPSTIVRISANAHNGQQSQALVSVPNNGQSGRQSTANFHFAMSSREKQQSYNTVNVRSTANGNLQPTVSLHVSPAAKSSSLNISSNEQVNRPSGAGLPGSGNTKSSFNVHLSYDEQKNQRPNSTYTHAQYDEPINHQLIANQQEFLRDEEVNRLLIPRSQIKQKAENDAGITTLRPVREANQQVNWQSNPILNIENTPQTAQLTNGSHTTQVNQQSNIQRTVSKVPANTMVRIAPKLESGAAREKEKPKNAEEANDRQCSFLISHPPKKQYTSLQQLANKVIETRQRLEMESIPWKKKILKSLEAVLTKRLRKIERETGEQANLEGEKISKTEKNKIGDQKEK